MWFTSHDIYELRPLEGKFTCLCRTLLSGYIWRNKPCLGLHGGMNPIEWMPYPTHCDSLDEGCFLLRHFIIHWRWLTSLPSPNVCLWRPYTSLLGHDVITWKARVWWCKVFDDDMACLLKEDPNTLTFGLGRPNNFINKLNVFSLYAPTPPPKGVTSSF
jgi:hypothetical protein